MLKHFVGYMIFVWLLVPFYIPNVWANNLNQEARQLLWDIGKNPDAECGGEDGCSPDARVKVKHLELSDDSNRYSEHHLEKEPDVRYHIHIEVENTGDDPAGNVEVRYYRSHDYTFGDSDDEYIASDWIDEIQGGELLQDRKTEDSDGEPLRTPDDLGEYYLYAKIINHDSGQKYISNKDDSDEYANLTVKEYVPPPPKMSIVIKDPVGGTWKTDREHSIDWDTTNVPKNTTVKIEYSLNGGDSWYSLASSTKNDGSKGWDMEDKPFRNIIKKDTDKAKIRITVNEFPKISVTSPKFKIDHKK